MTTVILLQTKLHDKNLPSVIGFSGRSENHTVKVISIIFLINLVLNSDCY